MFPKREECGVGAWGVTDGGRGVSRHLLNMSLNLREICCPDSFPQLSQTRPCSSYPTLFRIIPHWRSQCLWSARRCGGSAGLFCLVVRLGVCGGLRNLIRVGYCLLSIADQSRRSWTGTRVQFRSRCEMISRSTGPTWALKSYISIKTQDGSEMLKVQHSS